MKVLVAAEGTSLQSQVARRFENAVWYIIMDTETEKKEVYQNLFPHDHNNILVTASRLHVPTVIAGWVNAATARLMLSLNLHFVAAGKMMLRGAIRKLQQGELEIADLASFRHGLVTPGINRRRALTLSKMYPRIDGITTIPGLTSRGRFHLQQYSGRGH